jgi:transcriptional regulator with XRE-family HTH domain
MKEENSKSADRLKDVLRDEFCNDKDLMAYCARISRVTLDGYLSGRNKPNINRMYDLAGVIRNHDPEWLAGRVDSDKPHDSVVDNHQYSTLTDHGKREYRKIKALREIIEVNKEAWKANSKYERERLEAVMIRAKREYEDAQKALQEL